MIKYRQIRIEEREKIYELLKTGKSYRKIAEYLGRNKSSISREVSRNGADKLGVFILLIPLHFNLDSSNKYT